MENKNYKELLKDITTFIFDIDGVLTQCQVLVQNDGDLLRSFNVKDGYAIKQAVNQGYRIAIITGGNNIGTRKRCEQLGITDIYMANHLKIEPLKEFMDKYQLRPEEILYMGDDIPDVAPMKLVGLPTCPQDAVAEVKAVSRYISYLKGGEGCVREIIEQVMKVQGKWLTELTQRL
ncbi:MULTISPECIES: KdsC family phosphatase [unclassified Capnocytophaga]|jgi:HAD-superfamily hydrolase, subfamily IIIA|uniref:KdsC family phosphatase n=1 Tax=unclassified Capnocytophaga TaxID=2640652 RepID=UPI000202C5EC|nr:MULTISPECIES: HAD-IIIA family hydrolase [unclassified Capnocytophaga]EGD34566.1 YrbI family phosphatase [Capnocytophaga sp. oral taxon 338 str. F0234]MEB3005110.1 HAD-IIIA family hydrolase [Capnocytophaga sp. G2]